MWKKDETPKAPPARSEPSNPPSPQRVGARSTIGQSLIIDGAVRGTEDLLVEGRVEGEICLPDNRVTIGKSGRVEARVEALIVIVEGTVEGDLLGGEQIEIHQSGNVMGNITAPRVGLEDGAQFKGNIDMSPKSSPAKVNPPPRTSPSASSNLTPTKNKDSDEQPAGANPDKKLPG